MAIRGIFFDAAGVLYTRAQPTRQFVARLLDERGFSPQLSPEDQERQKALRAEADRGRVSHDAYWDHTLRMYGLTDAEERRALVARIDAYADQVEPIPGAAGALAGLKERGFVLGIITNTMHPLARKERWLESAGIRAFVDVLVCSTVLGVRKPEPAIYLSGVVQACLTAAESAFVGHAAEELDGARRAGLVTVAVLYEPGARADYYAETPLDLLKIPIFMESNK